MKLRFPSRQAPAPSAEKGTFSIGGEDIPYLLVREARRRLTLYIEPPGKVRLLVPLRARDTIIEDFLRQRTAWISARLAYYRKHPSLPWPESIEVGARLPFLGNTYTLTCLHNPERPQGCYPDGERLTLNLPDDRATREDMRLEILLFYKKEARRILKERTDIWAARMGLTYRRLAVGNPMRQWGSCSAKNDLRYNWRIVTAPLDVIDYLIVHELAHIVHKNHSACFWTYVGRYIPDYKKQRHILFCMNAGFTA